MPRAIALVALTIALALGGCLRNKYDLCGEPSPHPECDGGRPPHDGGLDAGAEDAAMIADSAASSDPDAGGGEDGGPDAGGADEDAGGGAAD